MWIGLNSWVGFGDILDKVWSIFYQHSDQFIIFFLNLKHSLERHLILFAPCWMNLRQCSTSAIGVLQTFECFVLALGMGWGWYAQPPQPTPPPPKGTSIPALEGARPPTQTNM